MIDMPELVRKLNERFSQLKTFNTSDFQQMLQELTDLQIQDLSEQLKMDGANPEAVRECLDLAYDQLAAWRESQMRNKRFLNEPFAHQTLQ